MSGLPARLLRLPLVAGLAVLCACPGGAGAPTDVASPAGPAASPAASPVGSPLADGQAPPATRLAIRLGGPVPINPDPRLDTASFQATVTVPDGPWFGGEALRLSGVFGNAVVSLDGVVIANVPPGPGSTEIDVVGKVPPGTHTVDIALTRDTTTPPMVKAGDRRTTPMLVDPPELLLRPASHLRGVALPMSGTDVTPMARVAGGVPGATVRFVATLDGRVIADLGTGPVEGGMARAPAVAWTLDRWQIGKPALYVIWGLLQAPDGTLLDAQGVRLGVRDVALDDTGFVVGGASQKLIAWRAGPHAFTLEELAILTRTGANTYEFHGSPATDQQLGVYDETGIATLLTPRCEGTYASVPEDQRAGVVQANLPLILDQSERAAWDILPHPTVVLWMSETSSLTELSKAIQGADPEGRPVVSVDLRMENLPLGIEPRDPKFGGAFVGEQFWEGEQGSIDVAVEAFAGALKAGARGGVIEHVEDPVREVAWAPMLAGFGVPPLTFDHPRASSKVLASNAAPGTAVWIDAPWLPPTAELARTANVTLSAWYDGAGTVVAGGTRTPVTLTPLAWTPTGPVGTVSRVALP